MQDILVYVRDLEGHTPAAYYGAQLAGARAGSVTGLYVCATPGYMAPTYAPELVGLYEENRRKLVQDAIHAKQPFLDWAKSMGVSNPAWIVAEGFPTDALADTSAAYDVLVLDQRREHEGPSNDIPLIVLKTHSPCVVLPAHGARNANAERFAIAWNGTSEAMRAIRAALPLMRGKSALLMRGEERQRYTDLVRYPEFNIQAYLEDHAVNVTNCNITAARDDVGAALLDHARDYHADLLVMGAYGRPRFSEWMLGGATRDVLTWAKLPVLLQH